jgi:trk system potassium uptake protein
MNRNNYANNYIVIAGCSRFGANMASMLSALRKVVIVIDNDILSFKKLPHDFKGFTILADATDIDELIRADITGTDIVVAATGDDNTNILISQIARRIFNVPKVICRLYDIEKEIICQDFNIEIIYPSKLSINELEKLIPIDSLEE